jgi:subtilase family serine protease
VLGGMVSASLLLTSSAMTTIELCPLVEKSNLVSPADTNRTISVTLGISSSDQAGLKAFVDHVSKPGDALYHKYITPQEFAARFGGNASDYQSLKNWAVANGLSISQESIGRYLLSVRGTVGTFNRLFKTQINNYTTTDGVTFYSAGIKPTVPAEIASKVVAVVGLTPGKAIAAQAKVAKVLGEHPAANSALKPAGKTDALGTGPGGTYGPQDLRTAYSIPTNLGALEKGQKVAIFEQGYYNPKDVNFYNKYFKAGSKLVQTAVAVDGSPITVEPEIELEACLDVDMIIATNPAIAEVQVYIADYNDISFDVGIADAYTAIADADAVTVVSASYGEDEGFFIADGTETLLDTATQQLAAEGISSFASSGDSGAYGDGYNYPYNVSDPYITSVGGTELLTTTGEQYEFEQVYNDYPYYGGSGGGISTYWDIPSYQNPSYVSGNGGSTTMRNVPDVAAEASVFTGVAVYVSDAGGWNQVGGTSVACPIWAGYLTNLNAAFQSTGLANIGFFNPVLYSLNFGYPADYMYDIVNGSNGYLPYYPGYPGYNAGFGYDNATGSGSIWGGGFALQVLISGTQAGTPPGSFTVSTKGTPTYYGASIKWTPSSGASGYAIGLYHEGVLYNIAEAYVEGPTKKSLQFLGLTANTTYTIYMWGFNASGGSPSETTTFTTAPLP